MTDEKTGFSASYIQSLLYDIPSRTYKQKKSTFREVAEDLAKRHSQQHANIQRLINNFPISSSAAHTSLENCTKTPNSLFNMGRHMYKEGDFPASTLDSDPVVQKIRSIYVKEENRLFLFNRKLFYCLVDIHERVERRTMTEAEYNFFLNSSEKEIVRSVKRADYGAYCKEFIK